MPAHIMRPSPTQTGPQGYPYPLARLQEPGAGTEARQEQHGAWHEKRMSHESQALHSHEQKRRQIVFVLTAEVQCIDEHDIRPSASPKQLRRGKARATRPERKELKEKVPWKTATQNYGESKQAPKQRPQPPVHGPSKVPIGARDGLGS